MSTPEPSEEVLAQEAEREAELIAWQKYQAEHEMPEKERVKATAEVVKQENQEAPTEEE